VELPRLDSRPKRDCSHLVHAIYTRAGFPYRYARSSDLYVGTAEFRRVTRPQPGDLVVWRGHVGIVVNPAQHVFYSAMRSGPATDTYDAPYWSDEAKSASIATSRRRVQSDEIAWCAQVRTNKGGFSGSELPPTSRARSYLASLQLGVLRIGLLRNCFKFFVHGYDLSTEYPQGFHKVFTVATRAARGEPRLASEARYLFSS
jgi:hypothetical protein